MIEWNEPPDLGTDSAECPGQELRPEQVEETKLLHRRLNPDGLLELSDLTLDIGIVDVHAVDACHDVLGLFPATLATEPTNRFGKEEETEGEKNTGDELETPGKTERGSAGDE